MRLRRVSGRSGMGGKTIDDARSECAASSRQAGAAGDVMRFAIRPRLRRADDGLFTMVASVATVATFEKKRCVALEAAQSTLA
ncbi:MULTISPECIES: hypothetical protein [Burkholderia]|nr:hypothetical protein [Burkholderia sp. GbtcB21]